MKLVSVSEMQAIEREANDSGLSYAAMMDHAGKGLAKFVSNRYDHSINKTIIGLVGSGNNGGDTLVALAELARSGWKTYAYLVRPRPPEDQLLVEVLQTGCQVLALQDDHEYNKLKWAIQESAFMLDGILGTGIHLPLKLDIAECLAQARKIIDNLPGLVVIAVDCPSGVDCDTGETDPNTIPAKVTVTMAAAKKGFLAFPAFSYIGEIVSVGIGILHGLQTWESIHRFIPEQADIASWLPDRPMDSHKGTFGTALIAAGSANYTGAALLAGKAAYLSGAGLVTIAVPSSIHQIIAGQLLEATWLLLPDEMGVFAEDGAEILSNNMKRVTSILVGPGLGMEMPTRNFLSRLFHMEKKGNRSGIGFLRSDSSGQLESATLPPLVLDADGLKLISQFDHWHESIPQSSVLTPHPGEMSIMTGQDKDQIQANRLATAEHFSREWGHIVILKGAFTVIASPQGETAVIPIATPALARAGTGDVLAGLVAGLLAQGMDPFHSSVSGAWIHARAGLLAESVFGISASVLAGDVLNAVPKVLATIEKVK